MTTKMHCNLFKLKQMDKRTFEQNNNDWEKRKKMKPRCNHGSDWLHSPRSNETHKRSLQRNEKMKRRFFSIFHQYLTLQTHTHTHAGSHRALLCKQMKQICIWNMGLCVLKTRSNGRMNEKIKRFDLYVIFHSFQLNNKQFINARLRYVISSIRLIVFHSTNMEQRYELILLLLHPFFFLTLFGAVVVHSDCCRINQVNNCFKCLDANTRLMLDLSTRKRTIRKRRAKAVQCSNICLLALYIYNELLISI